MESVVWQDALHVDNVKMLAEVLRASHLENGNVDEETLRRNIMGCLIRVKSTSSLSPLNLMEVNKSALSLFRSSKEPMTSEEVLAERKSLFDSEMANKEKEFAEAMRVAAPETPNFADDDIDKPIGEENISIMLASEISKRQLVSEPPLDSQSESEAEKRPLVLSLEERVRKLEERVLQLEGKANS